MNIAPTGLALVVAIWILAIIAGAMLLHASVVAPAAVRHTVIDVPVAGLGEPFDGYTFAVLADLHVRPASSLRAQRRAVAIANEAAPDLIVLLGDYGVSFQHARAPSVWSYRRMYPIATPLLRALRARDGVVAVLGNHDHYAGALEVLAWLRAVGVRVLMNESMTLERGVARLAIAGVDDEREGKVDPLAGCADVPATAPRIVLSHSPDAVLHFADGVRADLVLAGHTHGGQVVIPGVGALVRHARVCGRRTASGWVPNGRAPLYISRGVGSQIPLRFHCPPEVVVVRLRQVQPGKAQQPT